MFDGNLRMLIIDDEAHARERLRSIVGEVGGWTVVAEAGNGVEALELCELHKPDVVLLDIRMPGMDGIEVASHLCAMDVPPAVVFTTAYDEYAVHAFESHAVGYLLKPVRPRRLARALERAAKVSRWQLQEVVRDNPDLNTRTSIPVAGQGGIRLVPVSAVLSFHADQKYVRMVHSQGEELIDEPLKALEDEFADEFVRLHRNSLVRLSEIERLERSESGNSVVYMRGRPEPLPVSRRHLSTVKQRLT